MFTKKKILSCMGLVLAALLVSLGVIVYWANSAFPVEETVIIQAVDSSQKFESVIVKREAGATVSTSYSVRVRPAGSGEFGTEVLLVDKVSNPDLLAILWESKGLLIQLPSELQIYKRLDTVTIGGVLVKIRYESVEETVIAQAVDSSRKYESVIVKRESSASVSTSYSVRVRPTRSDEFGTEVLLVDKVSDPSFLAVLWEGETLRVQFPSELQSAKRLDTVVVGGVLVRIQYEPMKETVIAQAIDSSQKFEGIIVKRESGASVSTSYSVRVRPAGSDEFGAEVLLVDKVSNPGGLAILWQGELLHVHLPSELRSFKRLDTVAVGRSPVRIQYEIKWKR